MSNPSIRNHILRESFVSMVINTGLSLGFTYVTFHGAEMILRRELIIDALPQSFFVTFFGVLVPTLLTRKKIRAGHLASLLPGIKPFPANPFLRAIAFGIVASVAGASLHYVALHGLGIEAVAFKTALVYKSIYGAALSWIVTPLAVWITLKSTAD